MKSHWHISPIGDILSYHWGWLCGMLLLAFYDVSALAIAVAGLAFFHRHITIGPAILSYQSQRHSFIKFFFIPGVCLIIFGALLLTPFTDGKRELLRILGLIVAYWNIWHVISQKYGILRKYQPSKATQWVDRLVLLVWLPYFFIVFFFRGKFLFEGTFLEAYGIEPMGIGFKVFTIVLLLGSFSSFLYFERKSLPRISMMAGTLILFSLFGFLPLQTAYLLLIFSHALEYIVYVTLEHQQSWRSYKKTTATIVIFLILVSYLFHSSYQNMIFGKSATTALALWILCQAMIHFYWDGIIWKRRV